jgi:hypothetical protein
MVFFMGRHQLPVGHMGVDLGRCDIGVSQHHLNGTQIGTAFQ